MRYKVITSFKFNGTLYKPGDIVSLSREQAKRFDSKIKPLEPGHKAKKTKNNVSKQTK